MRPFGERGKEARCRRGRARHLASAWACIHLLREKLPGRVPNSTVSEHFIVQVATT